MALSRAFNDVVRTPLSTGAARLDLRLWGADVGPGLSVNGRLRLRIDGTLRIGARVRINSGSANNFVGGDRRTSFWVGSRATLAIGDDCAVSNSTIVCTDSVEIRPRTFIGGGCEIYDTDFHPIDKDVRDSYTGKAEQGPIAIGPSAFIGGWTIILKNVVVGEGAVVGAGSLVTKSIPPYEVWAGVPARKVRSLR
jgi:acetyltransferase-like isoleucine patch superfamily enzyme